MPDYSANFRRVTNSTAASESAVFLLEINHPDLVDPVRVVNWSDDIMHLGNVFTAVGFEITPPGDFSQGLPRASLAIDNIGRELMDWLELSKGGRGATVRMIQVLPSDPDTIEWDLTMNLENVGTDFQRVSGELAWRDLLNLPGVALSFTPDIAPGLY
jgi:hypothetical protein